MQRPCPTRLLFAAIGLAVACRADGSGDPLGAETTANGASNDDGHASSGGEPESSADASDSTTSSSTTSTSDRGETSDGSGDTARGDTTGEPQPDVPDNDYCADVLRWDPTWTGLELDLLSLVNAQRAAGASCGGQPFAPAPALAMDPALRCAARKHSVDMVVRGFFDHIDPDGETPEDRISMAGYGGALVGENIQGGGASAADAMAWWMDSPPHCGNIMNPAYQWMGAGYQPGGVYGTTWTQTFGGS